MSAIATAHVLSESALPDLLAAAAPIPRFLRRPLDRLPEFLAAHSRELPQLDASGFVLLTALQFLSEKGIEVLPGAHPDLAAEIQKLRNAHFVLLISAQQGSELGSRLDALSVTADELARFYETFNEFTEPGIGEAMQKCLHFVAVALSSVPKHGVLLVCLS